MVSVIIPVYNAEKTLERCVNSVLAQTYTDFEIILVDDGSTDKSGQICDEIQAWCEAEGIPCKVVHQKNGGVSCARNRGMELASGEFFVCIDSDDAVLPCYLEDLVKTQEKHPEFGHVLCGFWCISQNKDYIYTDKEPITVLDRKDYMQLAAKVLAQSPCIQLYKTDIVRNNRIKMLEHMSLAEDLLFNLCYFDTLDPTAIGVVNKPNYIYQDQDQGSLNHRYRVDLLEINEMVNTEVCACLVKWGAWDALSQELAVNSAFYRYIQVLNNTFSPSNPMTRREKTRYNSMVLQREGFREALKKTTVYITPLLRRAYESGNYKNVLLVRKLAKGKASLRKLFRRQNPVEGMA